MAKKSPAKKTAATPEPPKKIRTIETEATPDDAPRDLTDETTVVPSSAIQIAVGGRRWPIVTIPQCSICTHPERELIEDAIMMGLTAKPINDSISPQYRRVRHEAIMLHRTKHMPSSVALQQVAMAEHARQLAVDIEQAGTIITPTGILHEVIRQGFMAMASGALEIKASDLLTAVKLVREFEQQSNTDLDANAMMTAFMAFVDTAQNFIPASERAAFSEALSTHPIIKAMIKQSQASTTPGASTLTAGELEAAVSGDIEWIETTEVEDEDPTSED